MKLIVMTGLPATGKTAIAEALATQLKIPVFALDWIQSVLKANDIEAEKRGYAAYDLLLTLAQRQLSFGQSAILDTVLTWPRVRGAIRDLGMNFHVPIYAIRTYCSDEELHKKRLSQRQRNIPNWPELIWDDIESLRQRYTVWEHVGLSLDSVHPFEENLQKALKFVCQYDDKFS